MAKSTRGHYNCVGRHMIPAKEDDHHKESLGSATQIFLQFLGQKMSLCEVNSACVFGENQGRPTYISTAWTRSIYRTVEPLLNNGHGDNGHEEYRRIDVKPRHAELIPAMKLLSRYSNRLWQGRNASPTSFCSPLANRPTKDFGTIDRILMKYSKTL